MGTDVRQAERSEGGRLADLYRRHAPDAIRLAYVLTGERALAEDLVHEAFVKLAGRFLDLRNPDAFEAYLRRTVVNLANSHFRHRKVERAYLERQGRSAATEEAYEHDPETRDAMWSALRRLPARQRAAIVLRFYEDLPEDEIARLLRCRNGTVRSLVTRGVQAMRSEFRGETDA